jgi:tetratricopeptide (TPR) repeat protein
LSLALRALLLFAVALVACTAPRPRMELVDGTGWLEVRTADFAVLGNAPRGELRALARELVLFHALVEKATTGRFEKSPVPVRVTVFRTESQAKPFTGPFAGVMMRTLPGYFAFLSADRPQFQTRQTLFHEYSHYVLRRNRRIEYPRWYDEGLCEYLSSARFRDDAVIVGAALTERLDELTRWGVMPLAELFGGEEEGSGARLSWFYASSWALVHDLNSSPDGRARLNRFTGRLVRGEEWRSAYAASFDVDLEALQATVAEHVHHLERGVRFDQDIRIDSLEVPGIWAEAPVEPAEVAYQLGSMARLMAEPTGDPDSLATARAFFEQSIADDASHARARAALAWSRAVDGDWEASAALLEQAQREAPSDAVVALETGRVQLLRAAREEAGSAEADAARATLERAVQLGPDLPEAHAALGRAYAAQGREPRLAIAAFERARGLGAWYPPLEVELARQYLLVGEPRRAEALLVPVAADVGGGDTAREARRMLEETRSNGESAAPLDPPR